jgi:hypothetical protein
MAQSIKTWRRPQQPMAGHVTIDADVIDVQGGKYEISKSLDRCDHPVQIDVNATKPKVFARQQRSLGGTICPFDMLNHRHCYKGILMPCARIAERKPSAIPKNIFGRSGPRRCTTVLSAPPMKASDRMITDRSVFIR